MSIEIIVRLKITEFEISEFEKGNTVDYTYNDPILGILKIKVTPNEDLKQ